MSLWIAFMKQENIDKCACYNISSDEIIQISFIEINMTKVISMKHLLLIYSGW